MKKIPVAINPKKYNLKAISEHSEEFNDLSPSGSYKINQSLNRDEHVGIEESNNALIFREEEQKGEK